MENEPEVIRQQMEEHRTALTEKLEKLEDRVMGVATAVSETVENVKEGVTGTVESVKETVESVKETVAETVHTVKEAFDLRLQVQRHPYLMLGGSVGVGFALGMLLPRWGRRANVSSRPARAESWSEPARYERRPSGPSLWTRAKEALSGATQALGNSFSSLTGGSTDVVGVLSEGLERLRNAAVSSVVGFLKETVVRALPAQFADHARTILDDVAAKLEGTEPGQQGQQQPRGESREPEYHTAVGYGK